MLFKNQRPNIIALNARAAASAQAAKTAPVSQGLLDAATMQLNQNAVKFGEDLRRDLGKAYPFWYSFVPSQNLADGVQDYGDPALLQNVTFAGNGPDGYDVPVATGSGSTYQPGLKEIAVRMDRDLNFDLLEIRYSVRYTYSNVARLGKFKYLDGSNIHIQDGFPRYDAYPYKFGVGWHEFIRANVFIRSGQNRSIYGGLSSQNSGGTKDMTERPVPLTNLQGLDDGKNVLRTPYLISKEGVVIIKFQNFSPYALRVNGYLFGYKVAF